jgi:cell division protein ZapE
VSGVWRTSRPKSKTSAAAADPQDLYAAGDGLFEFERTVSRLMEMQSADYLAEGHGIAAD